MNGVESFKNVKKNISELKEHEKIENDPLLKLSTKLSEIDKGFLFRKNEEFKKSTIYFTRIILSTMLLNSLFRSKFIF